MDILLAAYLPQDRGAALARGEDLPKRTAGAALFADISGFTPLTEALATQLGPRRGAEALTQHLDHVYAALIAEVERFGGSVIGFAGDSIMCWFDDGSWELGAGGWGSHTGDDPPTPISQLPPRCTRLPAPWRSSRPCAPSLPSRCPTARPPRWR
jgi:hypothetical protein